MCAAVGLSRHGPHALPDTIQEAECPECIKRAGFCRSCQRAILPQLAQPGWVRLIGTQADTRKKAAPMSAEAAKVQRRKERKRLRVAMRTGLSGLRLTLALSA